MPFDPALTGIIDDIYEGSLDENRWRSAMRGFLDVTGARAAFLAIVDNNRQSVVASTVVGPEESRLDDALSLYREELVELDPGFNIERHDGGRFRFGDTSNLNTSDPNAWRAFIRHDFGSGDYHSLISSTSGSLSVSLALHTHPEQTAITAEQERVHDIVFSHLSRAARLLVSRPELARSEEALILVDENAHVLDASPGAEAILSAGCALGVGEGKLRVQRGAQDDALKQHIRRACQPSSAEGAGSWMTLASSRRLTPWLVHFEPVPLLPLGSEQKVFGCMIRLTGGASRSGPEESMIAEIFGLTRREAEVAARMVRSADDLKTIAGELGMAYETARTHARSLMAKIGVGNRIELIMELSRYR